MSNNKKLVLGFYDTEVGDYDEYNPRYVRDKKGCEEILYVIATKEPYTLTGRDIADELGMDNNAVCDILSLLVNINAIDLVDGKYKLNFPAFVKRDMELLGDFNVKVGQAIGDKIISILDKIDERIRKMSCFFLHDIKRLRYHVIGCSTMDGGAIDYLAQGGVITTSKIQPGNRDYLIIGNEELGEGFEFSENLLCSCNIFRTDRVEFCSFGDSNGNRNDMLRFFRRVQTGLAQVTEHKQTNIAYVKLNSGANKLIAERCGDLVVKSIDGNMNINELKDGDKDCVELLKVFGYIDVDCNDIVKCIVPVFTSEDEKMINEISDMISKEIFEFVKDTVDNLDKTVPDMTSIRHGIEFRDIANELWHLMFGAVNEYLVDRGIFSAPAYKSGEGRYLQCIYIK